jgi:branched-chain amino acid transport system substrate-binding protein
VIDVPQALSAFESVAPKLLDDAGIEYDLVKIAPGTADMTPQMQQIANSDAGVVQVVGNDAFCIAAFNGLNTVGYEGEITTITQCITDATREAVDSSVLEGMYVTATAAVGATDDPGYQLYVAIMEKYTDDSDIDNGITMGAYVSMASFLTGLEKLKGDVTTESVNSTIKAMDKTLMPGGGGLEYQCGGTAVPATPSVCTSQVLQAKLDAEGKPAEYTVGNPVS